MLINVIIKLGVDTNAHLQIYADLFRGTGGLDYWKYKDKIYILHYFQKAEW